MAERTRLRRRERDLVNVYLHAKGVVVEQGHAAEIDWQEQLSFSSLTESGFLREAAWVVLSSGMRESVVRDKFPCLTVSFRHWVSAAEICRHRTGCVTNALRIFGNRRKIIAICNIAERVGCVGFATIKDSIRRGSVEYLETLAFIGPVTRYHLAKNIGLDVVKPDRHLVRVANVAGYRSPQEMCEVIALHTGDRLSVVDLVIWRFATIESKYASLFKGDRITAAA